MNGLALAVWVYTAANISGGHLNPAVTMSTLLCGFYPVLHSILYIFLQVGRPRDNCSWTLCRLHRMHCATGIGFPRRPCMVVPRVRWICAYHARLSFSGGVCKQT